MTYLFQSFKEGELKKKNRVNETKYGWSVSFLILILFWKVRVNPFYVVVVPFSFQQLSNIVTPTENKLLYSFEWQRQQNLEVPKLKVRHIFIFYWAHNQLYIRHPWIPMWRKSVTLYYENMCNSNKYRKSVKEKSRQEKKIQEHLAQLTKSVICYRIGINNNPVTSLKQIAMTSFPFSFSW